MDGCHLRIVYTSVKIYALIVKQATGLQVRWRGVASSTEDLTHQHRIKSVFGMANTDLVYRWNGEGQRMLPRSEGRRLYLVARQHAGL